MTLTFSKRRTEMESSNTSQAEQQVKSAEVSGKALLLSTVAPKPEDFRSRIEYSAACHKAGVLPKPRRVRKGVLSREEYDLAKDRAKVEADLAEERAEYESRPLCSKCGFKHHSEKECILPAETKRKGMNKCVTDSQSI
jgi:hypothetical protein